MSLKTSDFKIISVVAARPNFMKIAPFIRAIDGYNYSAKSKINHVLVHTGQHYDIRMSRDFFDSLNIPDADIHLNIGSGTHSEQVGYTMIALEKVFIEHNPDWVVVVGDVNATLAASVTAKKLKIKVCHIEAGLRSNDMSMPEEINRLVTDRLSDLLLTPDKLSFSNLINEGVPENKIKFVGNIMIDSLDENIQKAKEKDIIDIINSNIITESNNSFSEITIKKSSELNPEDYGLITLHRPSNVDDNNSLNAIIDFLINEAVADLPIIWPIHPRSHKRLIDFCLWDKVINNDRLIILHPVGYHEMLRLNMSARIVLTDSGGLQEECTVLGTPCITLRWNTERPVTLRENGGTNVLVGNNIEKLREEYRTSLSIKQSRKRPELWDGNTAKRCLDAILKYDS